MDDVAARLDATLVLTAPGSVPTQTTSYLNRLPPTETHLATAHLR